MCHLGYYFDDAVCTACYQGTFKNQTGPDPCTACPTTGTTTPGTGATDVSQCSKFQMSNPARAHFHSILWADEFTLDMIKTRPAILSYEFQTSVILVTLPLMVYAQRVISDHTKIQQDQIHVHLVQPLVPPHWEEQQIIPRNVVRSTALTNFFCRSEHFNYWHGTIIAHTIISINEHLSLLQQDSNQRSGFLFAWFDSN